MSIDQTSLGALVTELSGMVTHEGLTSTPLEGVNLMAAFSHYPRTPLMYEVGLIIVAQGGKIGYLGEREIHYGAGHYLVQAMPLPFECETRATPEEPLLGLSIRLDRLHLAELVAQLPAQSSVMPPDPMAAVALNEEVTDAALRLVRCLKDAVACRVLGEGRLRELIFAVLKGPHGDSLRRLIVDRSHYLRIAEALQFMQEHYTHALSVEQIARQVNMSTSHFHHHFKRITQAAPLQYLKQLRLLKARALLAEGSLQIGQVASRVGYRSSSQFSREYKQYFDKSPMQDSLHRA
ncbi:HTH-type transcriptional activator RhaS [Halomonadaceae bacterium LMG 33818]|uniref:AraC family transcriptional regulator n=1 Tax=Cernens ardua TaxID=3402176 RepID=UPI003EDBBF82